MKVLVYGAGVIGCYLAHVLCEAENDVTVLARGSWKDTIERDGIVIRHHLQRKTTIDHPRIIGSLDRRECYDVVFAVMQYQQMEKICPDLAQVDSPLVVLVGNNMSAEKAEGYICANTTVPKTILFGFQGTAGRREDGKVICVRFGGGSMSIGGLHSELAAPVRERIAALFQGTKYRLTWTANMDAWYKCHLAFILPVAYLTYTLGCDLTQATWKQIGQMLNAAAEGYDLLNAQHYAILPADSREKLHGISYRFNHALMMLMAKTSIGRLAASDHCRHAVTEMESLDKAWARLYEKTPDFAAPHWNALRSAMPDWQTLHRLYDGKK